MWLQVIIIQHGPQYLPPAMVAENRSARVVGEFIKTTVKFKNERLRTLICRDSTPWFGCSWPLLRMVCKVAVELGWVLFRRVHQGSPGLSRGDFNWTVFANSSKVVAQRKSESIGIIG